MSLFEILRFVQNDIKQSSRQTSAATVSATASVGASKLRLEFATVGPHPLHKEGNCVFGLL